MNDKRQTAGRFILGTYCHFQYEKTEGMLPGCNALRI